ncbi:MAG: hypothetical protein LKE28_05275 [Sphaerochaeta sp.]|nr:hypothetical protein [Sphaerochaeta sp.]
MMFILVGGKIVVAYLFRVYNISLRYCSLDLLVHSLVSLSGGLWQCTLASA